MSGRLVIYNGEIITMSADDTRARGLAVENGRILRVGSGSDVEDLIRDGWPVYDLAGRVLLPGFIDAHSHLMLTGQAAAGVDLSEARNISELLERIASAATDSEPGAWIRGVNLNELDLQEQRMPTRTELDRVSPNLPVFILHATCHLCAFNTPALEIVNPPLDLDGLDMEGGRPTGVVRDPGILTYVHPVMARLTETGAKVAALQAAARQALAGGITTVHALDGGDLGPGDTRIIWENRNQLPVKVICYNQNMDLSEVREMGLPRVGGCICADGAFEAHTASLFEPYTDEPDNYGALTYSTKVMEAFILEAHGEGLQIAVHCEAEGSIEQVLSAMEKACRLHPRSDHRHRIEHFELPTWNQIERVAAAGIIASMQPAFLPAFIGLEGMEKYKVLLGSVRLERVHPYRTIIDRGIPICGGSDSPVTPFNPLAGMHAAVNHPNPEQRATIREALQMFTTTAAWSAFEENEKGAVEPGKAADFVVLNKSPYESGGFAGLKVEAVLVDGQLMTPGSEAHQ